MARTGKPLILTDTQRVELERLYRAPSAEHRLHQRAHIILLAAQGHSYDSITEQVGVSRAVVGKWKYRYMGQGIEGLADRPRPGPAPIYGPEDQARVVEKACSKPTKGYSSWTQQRIAEEVGMSQSTVCRMLAAHQLRPHKTEYWCGKSPDPKFESKMLEIVGLYLDPPDNALVLCVDEKTQIQALDRTQPELPLQAGRPRRLTTTYKRHGTVGLRAALDVHSGQILATPIDRNDGEGFLKFLKKLDRTYRGKTLHIIADNFSAHKHHKVKQWLAGKRKFVIHYTPTYSSWLNQVEIWFGILSKDVLKDAVWHSTKQLVDQLSEYITTYNMERAAPFKWTYDGRAK